ncbi:hypothetical protein [Streptomyces griseoluteus]|uniref:hypothetical protein n=1 Tax=Streptomyces griseoluteus TaxID=29306 RepID=UPI0036F8F3E2
MSPWGPSEPSFSRIGSGQGRARRCRAVDAEPDGGRAKAGLERQGLGRPSPADGGVKWGTRFAKRPYDPEMPVKITVAS